MTAGRTDRWTLPDLDAAIQRCRMQNDRGIRCILAPLGEYARSERQVRENLERSFAAIAAIDEQELDASLTVKMTALGALIDRNAARDLLLRLSRGAYERGIGFEADMEGRGFVEMTVEAAIASAREGVPVTLALQASLDLYSGRPGAHRPSRHPAPPGERRLSRGYRRPKRGSGALSCACSGTPRAGRAVLGRNP